jgi:integrase/recombinase XerD
MMGALFFGGITMKKIKMASQSLITFEQGCNLYLDNCRARNLRQGTINHYRQSYTQFYKYFDPDMPIEEMTKEAYDKYVIYLRETIHNDVSINSYLRDMITTLHFLMNEGYLESYKMSAIKVDKTPVETYTEEELAKLLRKPDLRNCDFAEYQSWVMTSFLFATGVRQRSLHNIKIKDLDFDNKVIYVNVTKNRKPLIVPMEETLKNTLLEYLKYRQYKTTDDYLFSNIFGQQLTKSTGYHRLYWYNKARGVETTGIHRYRHTFAKQWVLNGGDVVTLSRMLGHSSLDITQNYLNLLVSDVAKKADEISLLSKFSGKQRIKMK